MLLKLFILYHMCFILASTAVMKPPIKVTLLNSIHITDETLNTFKYVSNITPEIMPYFNKTSKQIVGDVKSLSYRLNQVLDNCQVHSNYSEEYDYFYSSTLDLARLSVSIEDNNKELPNFFNKNFVNKTLTTNAKSLIRSTITVLEKIKNEFEYYFSLINQIEKDGQVSLQINKQELFYDLLRSYVVAEILGFDNAMTSFYVQQYLKEETYRDGVFMYENSLRNRLKSVVSLFKSVLAETSLFVIRPDLEPVYIKEKTITFFKSLFQSVLYGAEDISSSIFARCPKPEDHKKSLKPVNIPQQIIKQRYCSNILDCYTLNIQVNVCLHSKFAQQITGRRYKFVEEYKTGEDNRPCNPGYSQSSVLHIGFKSHKTIVCSCICDDHEYHRSERYISLEELVTDVHGNKVVVGLRLIKNNKTLSFEIEEAQMLPGAVVDQSRNWIRNNSIYRQNSNNTLDTKNFYELSWFNRGIMLEDVKVSTEDHVITGVKFMTQTIDSTTFVKLAIHETKINFTSSTLIPESGHWRYINYGNNIMERTIDVSHREPPTNVKTIQKINFQRNYLVNFEPTDVFSSDAGQTTVPYIDLQEIQTTRPITSLGLYLANSDDSGGFIKLGVELFDVTRFL